MGEFLDDEWRQILEDSGFAPSGATEEVWRSPDSDLAVRIDVDREADEPYYQIVSEGGGFSMKDSDSERLRKMLLPPEPPKPSPEEEAEKDREFLKSMGIVGGKSAGRPPRFSFSVPMKSSGPVAFQLAKAGVDSFDAANDEKGGLTVFTFPTEPEMHVAEDIVKEEFADQIAARKGLWSAWSPASAPVVAARHEHAPPALGQEPFIAGPDAWCRHHGTKKTTCAECGTPYCPRCQRKRKAKRGEPAKQASAFLAREMGKVAGQWGDRSWDSDRVHDVLDKHRPGQDAGGKGFDQPVPDEQLPLVLKELDGMTGGQPDLFLGVVAFLASHGSDVPKLYRDRARQIAFALAQDEGYLGEWKDPGSRRAELENEIELLEGGVAKPAVASGDAPWIDGWYRRNPCG